MSFRASSRLLAAGIHALSPNATAELATELLPPLPLYRRLLRVHRKVLPAELRLMGDDYIKAEFRRTRSTDNPLHIVGFLSEWKKYLDFHEAQIPRSAADAAAAEAEEATRRERVDEMSAAKPGKALDPSILETLSADQIGQLYELFNATKEVYLSPEELAAKLEAEGNVEEGIPAGQVLPDLGEATRIGGKGDGERR
ncbi:hypothetical protein JCM10450v2_008015 [Rhodotorula kratochvilovae]